MSLFFVLSAVVLAMVNIASAQNVMAAASFAWPPPRLWDPAIDDLPPCGHVDGAGNRTAFPMKNGRVSLVAQDVSWYLEVGISFDSEPKFPRDFAPFMKTGPLARLDVGISCVAVPDAPSFVEAGGNATLQLKYVASYDSPTNQSFFVCADITFVPPSEIPFAFPCVNTTMVDPTATTAKPTVKPKPTKEPKPSGDGWSPGKESRLSEGAIAGVAAGGLVAAAGILTAISKLCHVRKEDDREADRVREEAEWVAERAERGTIEGSKGGVRSTSTRLHDLSRRPK